MNYKQVRSYSTPLLTSKVGNVSLQTTRLLSGVYSFDLWFNPTNTDLCFNTGFDFDSRPNREKLYNHIINYLPGEIEEAEELFKPACKYFFSEIQKTRTKARVLKLLQNAIREGLYPYEKHPDITVNNQTINYRISLNKIGFTHLTFGVTGKQKYVSLGFVIGASNFGFRDVTGVWTLDGILNEIKRQLSFRSLNSKECILSKIEENFIRDKEELSHLLYRFNHNLKIV